MDCDEIDLSEESWDKWLRGKKWSELKFVSESEKEFSGLVYRWLFLDENEGEKKEVKSLIVDWHDMIKEKIDKTYQSGAYLGNPVIGKTEDEMSTFICLPYGFVEVDKR